MSGTSKIATNERPIIFSGPMVRAIIGGRKTQTRRVVTCANGQDADAWEYDESRGLWEMGIAADFGRYGSGGFVRCPYGIRGDRLWLRETFALHRIHDGTPPSKVQPTLLGAVAYMAGPGACDGFGRWRPSIHMPRWASRLTLDVTGVRVELVNDISEEDAIAEGVTPLEYHMADGTVDHIISAREQYSHLWDALNAKRGYGWDADPWVWAISFRVSEAGRG
jgi:hypothetical protein